MNSNKLLQNILKEVNSENADQIVSKHLKGVDIEVLVDSHDLLIQLQKSLETHLFSTILAHRAEIAPSNE